jgi:pSer/pThr/pTyr-binding forkhead associated (FHA) protein
MNNTTRGKNLNTGNTAQQDRHVLVINDGQRRAYALEAAAYSIGRDPSNAIVLKSESISRQHALLLRVPAPGKLKYQYRIIDGNSLGKASANGLFVNEERISSHELRNGDMIRFGKEIEASYLTVAMGEAEFAQYLESVSYQSIKSHAMNPKATVVADDLAWDDLEKEISGESTDLPQGEQTVLSRKTSGVPSAKRSAKVPEPANPLPPTAENVTVKKPVHPWAKTMVDRDLFSDRKKLFFTLGGLGIVLGGTLLGAFILLTGTSASQNDAQSIAPVGIEQP